MAGQAALMSREAVRSVIKASECDKGKSQKAPKFSGKTTSKQ